MSITPAESAVLPPVNDRPGPPAGGGGKGKPAHAGPAATPAQQDSVEIGENAKPASQDREPGVVRLLRDGHFQGKGVADVRLRMNFAEHFPGETASAAPPSLAATSEAMHAEVQEKLAELDALSDDETAREGVEAAVLSFEQSLAELADAPADDQPTAGEALTAARQTLVDALGEALLTDAEPAEAAAAADAEQTEQATGEEAVAAWLAELDASLNTLIDALAMPGEAESGGLPPLMEPSGRGAAYEKFLAQYQQMMGMADAAAEAVDDDGSPASDDEASVDTLG